MKNFIISLLILLLLSCENDNMKDIGAFKNIKMFTDDNFTKENLFSKYQCNLSYKINDIIVKDNLVIVCTKNKEKPISVLDKIGLKKITDGGSYGNGPGEQLYFYNFSNIPNSSKFWVSDIITKRITRYDINSLLSDTNYYPKKQLHLDKKGHSIYSPIVIGNKIIGPSMDGLNRLCMYDIEGNLISTGGIFPLKRDDNVSDEINANAYYGRFDALKNDKNDILLVKINMFSPIVEFYDEKGNERITLVGPEQFTPKYSIGNAGGGNLAFAPDKEIRIANSDVFLSNSYVYTLYSGKKEGKDSPAVYCNIVYQFDWKGNCVNKYILDKEIICFYVDEKSKLIFGGAADGVIYSFPFN